MSVRHFIRDLDFDAAEQRARLVQAEALIAAPQDYAQSLAGRTLGMIFRKSSTRTRVSFEVGMHQLGGHAIFLADRDNQMGRGESLTDTAQVLSRYVDALLIRTFTHVEVQELARASRVPVINGLDDLWHPCQALADLLTIQRCRGSLAGQQLVYLGDGNNVAHSLLAAGALAGLHVRLICPPGHRPHASILEQAQAAAQSSGARLEVSQDPAAVADADVVYTDVWASMGDEDQAAARRQSFAAYQVDGRLMRLARPDAIFLHCLPAHRGEEVSGEVIDGAQSRVFDQAENRLHVQKALLLSLLT